MITLIDDSQSSRRIDHNMVKSGYREGKPFFDYYAHKIAIHHYL